MQDQIIEFLAGGFSKQDVASTLSISIAAIDAFLEDKDFVSRLSQRARELQSERMDKKYLELEEKTLNQLRQDISMLDSDKLCRVLETVSKNRIAARSPANHYQNPSASMSITLILPSAALSEKIVTDSKNQVIAIGDRSMATMPISGVQNLFRALETESKDELETLGEKGDTNETEITRASFA